MVVWVKRPNVSTDSIVEDRKGPKSASLVFIRVYEVVNYLSIPVIRGGELPREKNERGTFN